nr:unnamed protein product [Callosobruchus chinensis]
MPHLRRKQSGKRFSTTT